MRHIMCVLSATYRGICRLNTANGLNNAIKCSILATALPLHDYSAAGTHTTLYAASAPLRARGNATSALLFPSASVAEHTSGSVSAVGARPSLGLILHPRALYPVPPGHAPLS